LFALYLDEIGDGEANDGGAKEVMEELRR